MILSKIHPNKFLRFNNNQLHFFDLEPSVPRNNWWVRVDFLQIPSSQLTKYTVYTIHMYSERVHFLVKAIQNADMP